MIENILAALAGFIIAVISKSGYWGILLLMTAESANIPIPSEVIMPFSGYLVSTGQFSFWPVVLLGTLGNVLGSLISYWVARYGGRPFVEKYGRYIFLSHHHLDQADRWFARFGMAAIFIGRLLPVVRTFISFPAGIARVPLPAFILYTFLGALPFVAFLTYLGQILGDNWESIRTYFRGADVIIVIIAAVFIIGWLWSNAKRKNRARTIK